MSSSKHGAVRTAEMRVHLSSAHENILVPCMARFTYLQSIYIAVRATCWNSAPMRLHALNAQDNAFIPSISVRTRTDRLSPSCQACGLSTGRE